MNSSDTPPEQPAALYAKQEKVYPKRITGTFRRIKWLVLSGVLGLYYLLPWIRWSRGENQSDQAVLADLAGQRLYFFNIEIWPQEVYYLTGILVVGAVGLFLATAVAGRVWCGFTCPQTIWTDLFLLVERYIEGDRNTRMKLDQGPLTLAKVWRKTAKHLAWLLISLATGGVAIFYFVDAPVALNDMLTGTASTTVFSWVAIFTGITYLLAGWAREQVCTYMCPWPRFQGAMFDEHSLIVTYETWRGEPRGKAKVDTIGDCVDCNLCVNVCPVGIDIREGQQFQCIGCALCVDACDSIMTKLNRPLGLVAYDSTANQVAREQGRPTSRHIVRPRTIAYTVMLVLVTILMAYSLMNRSVLEINVQRDRAPLFVTLSSGEIRNGYTFKILNMVNAPVTYRLSVEKLDGALLTVIGIADTPVDDVILHVGPDQVGTFRVFVRAPLASLDDQFNDLEFVLHNADTGKKIDYDVTFAGPAH